MPERIYVAAVEGFIIICFPGLIRNFAAFGICIFMATLSGAWAAIISPSRVLWTENFIAPASAVACVDLYLPFFFSKGAEERGRGGINSHLANILQSQHRI